MEVEHKIQMLLEEKFREPDFFDCFVIEIILRPGNKLEVFIDCDKGVSFDTCQKISRYLESYIDEEGWLGEKYILEVSSPGLSRPLKLKRQYPRNVGRKVEISMVDGSVRTGILTAVSDEGIILEEEIKRKEGKKNIKEKIQMTIPFENIRKTIVKVTF